ncbi:MAG: universal stress protein [Bacteroides sp.]|nr:universal stress protein [Bacteroides sp.]
MEEKYLTLAIHTYERAIALKRILESHKINVRFEKLYLSNSNIASGIRVVIKENDLPLALKVMESSENYIPINEAYTEQGSDGVTLIPVDFSPNSMLACKVGFDIAKRLGLKPLILHAYASPILYNAPIMGDSIDGSLSFDVSEEMAELQAGVDMRKESGVMMDKLSKKICEAQAKGELPDIKFSTESREGIPEEVIKDFCNCTPPVVVVMATRGKDKRDEALIGSVTAEVLDSCRVPVFVVPENCQMTSVEAVKRVVYFCNLDRQDILSVDSLMRMFDYPQAYITLVPVNERAGTDIRERVDSLRDFFNKSFPDSHFTAEVFPMKTLQEDFANYVEQAHIEMLIVPNKKRNIFQRLFKPGFAHRLLFERDMPMLALPV